MLLRMIAHIFVAFLEKLNFTWQNWRFGQFYVLRIEVLQTCSALSVSPVKGKGLTGDLKQKDLA